MLAPHIHSTIDDVRPVTQNSETTFVRSADGIEEEEDEDDDIFDTLSLSNLLDRTIDSDDSDNEDDDESFHRSLPPEKPDVQINYIFKPEDYLSYFPFSELTALGPIPDSVKGNVNTYSAVLGDIFHFIDRIKVPIHHELKKAWKAALSRSFFIFDEKIMKIVTDALKKERNMSDKDIEKMLYYNTKFFYKRVPRVCPPSSVLYYRVRAVYDVYAHRVDSSGRPLLNEAAKKKF